MQDVGMPERVCQPAPRIVGESRDEGVERCEGEKNDTHIHN